MAAYIDQVATVESLNAMKPFLRDRGQVQLLRRIMNHVGKIPAADVVPVVRCNACENWKSHETELFGDGFGYCRVCMMDTHDWHYCSYGERKDGD